MRKPEQEYAPGAIIVQFKDGVTQEAAVELVKSFALTPGNWASFNRALVVMVPFGEERKWVEEFKENELVQKAFLNTIHTL